MVAAIVLAAGASTRLGWPKQLVPLHRETLLERAVRVAREAGCSPVVVVLGANAAQIGEKCDLAGVDVRCNSEWEEGLASSLRVGIAAVRGLDAAVVLTCDMPAVTARHLRELMADGDVAASSYGGRRGVPAFFPGAMFQELLALRGDAGARALLESARAVPLPAGELDIDTPEDVAAMRRFFADDKD
jgi:molybdenum cofactor cytidylyltransferase